LKGQGIKQGTQKVRDTRDIRDTRDNQKINISLNINPNNYYKKEGISQKDIRGSSSSVEKTKKKQVCFLSGRLAPPEGKRVGWWAN